MTLKLDGGESEPNIVSLDEAKMDLVNLLSDMNEIHTSKSSGFDKKRISDSFTIIDESAIARTIDGEVPVLHIFNFENQGGFAIMSGNRGLPSLLALSDTNEIKRDTYIDNPGFVLFLENLEEKYFSELSNSSVSRSSSSSRKEYGEWANKIYKDGGYCKVKWNQGKPYNMYCPLKDGEQAVTGCVPTAVAQLMSIYKHPTLYDGLTLDWELMTQSPYATWCSTEGQSDIGYLLFTLGKKSNLNVTYNSSTNGGSSASSDNIPRTLKNYGYSNGGQKKDYKTEAIVSELKNGYSVLVSGYSHKKVNKVLGIKVKTKYSGGHAWLCHGLLERSRTVRTYNASNALESVDVETQWYVLCNWGWGGSYDGYFLSGVFDTASGPVFRSAPAESEAGDEDGYYRHKVTAITGIRK